LVGGNVWRLIVFVGVVKMIFKGCMTGEPLIAQGTLVVVWEAYVEGSQDWVVRPIGAIIAKESMSRLWGLGHALGGWGRVVLIDDVVLGFVGSKWMTSESGLIGELSVTQRALVDGWEMCLCMECSQDGVV
jgi:hypothetical protein